MGLDSKLDDHVISSESREGWVAGYGDSLQRSKENWIVCSCGWEYEEGSDFHTRYQNTRLEILEHQMTVLAANQCDDCQPERPCKRHCPRGKYHSHLKKNEFCKGCGMKGKGNDR